jgi:hypothetical protein
MKVVLPAPRKPVTIMTGIFGLIGTMKMFDVLNFRVAD